MKTVLVMLSRGFVARNLLRTDTLPTLAGRSDLRIVLLVPGAAPDYFRNELSAYPNVLIEEAPDLEYGPFRKKVFEPILQKMVYLSNAKFFTWYGGRPYKRNKNRFTAPLRYVLSLGFSKLKFLIPLLRWIEYRCWPDRVYGGIFEKYKPDLVVSTAIKTKRDIALLKEARRRSIPSVGMTRSWDNLDRILVSVVPDTLLVQNEVMKSLATAHHGISADQIAITGFPQFDLYHKMETFRPREEFLRSLGLDPARPVIMFGSEGAWAPYGVLVAELLISLNEGNAFGRPCSIIVRPHFSDLSLETGKTAYDHVAGLPNVHLDRKFRTSKFFTDKWDASAEEMIHLANELKHSDVLVTYASTLAVEASLLDTPIVNIDYRLPSEPKTDGPFYGMFYTSPHYAHIVATGATRFARSDDEVLGEVRRYLEDPALDREGRRACVELLVDRFDGQSGKRAAEAILGVLDAPAGRKG